MARTVKTVTIDGLQFEVGQVGARQARDIALRMLDVHGQVLAALGSVPMSASDPADGQLQLGGALGRSLVALARAMRDKEFWTEVQKPLFEQVLQAKRQVLRDEVYEELFLAHPEREIALLKACVAHNCGDFTTAFAGATEVTESLQVQATAPHPAGEGEPSTGTSGAPSSGA